MLCHRLRIVGNFQAFEELAVGLGVPDIEEVLHHRQQEGLAEAARARDECYVVMIMQKFSNKTRLIYKIIAFAEFGEVLRTNG